MKKRELKWTSLWIRLGRKKVPILADYMYLLIHAIPPPLSTCFVAAVLSLFRPLSYIHRRRDGRNKKKSFCSSVICLLGALSFPLTQHKVSSPPVHAIRKVYAISLPGSFFNPVPSLLGGKNANNHSPVSPFAAHREIVKKKNQVEQLQRTTCRGRKKKGRSSTVMRRGQLHCPFFIVMTALSLDIGKGEIKCGCSP